MIIGIVAVDSKWGIGKKNGLLFKLKKDMKFFQETTTNKIVCMGYNTLLSFPGSKPLKNRRNLVLCPEGVEIEGCECFHSFEEILEVIKKLSVDNDVYIIGGAMFYKSMLPHYEKILVTKVAADGEAEVFFADLDWNISYRLTEESEELEDNGYKIKFTTYERLYWVPEKDKPGEFKLVTAKELLNEDCF